jgi:hypothetical protein
VKRKGSFQHYSGQLLKYASTEGRSMAQKATLMAGFGGLAVLATALTHIGGGGLSESDKVKAQDASARAATSVGTITANQAGPWYAFCHEYATDQFDHGEDPMHEWGVNGHQVPREAEEGTVEITRDVPNTQSKLHETEKFSVRNHTVGNLTDCVPPGASLRIVIATVPDPDATQMPAEFDRDIEAIQHAAAALQYNYTRFWLPWRTGAAGSKGTGDAEAEAHRRDEPGILCFRKNDQRLANSGERLFVLLVGETPTSGINRLQLAHAIYYRDEFVDKKQITNEDKGLLKIAGPHFAASLPSMQDVLTATVYDKAPQKEKAAKKDKKADNDKASEKGKTAGKAKNSQDAPKPIVTVISPDTSSSDLIGGFRKYCDSQTPHCILNTLSFDSDQAKQVSLAYLKDIGYPSDTVAELVEDESAFGESESYPHPPESTHSPAGSEASVAVPTEKGNLPLDAPDYRLSLRFPRDLATARSASDAESERIAGSNLKYIGLPKGALPTHLAVQDAIDSDAPPAFGDIQKPADVARQLTNIVQQLRAARIRGVVVNATNPLDRIYLLEYLHNQLPDVRAVTIDADALELNRPQFVDLAGTIAVTSLPIIVGLTSQNAETQNDRLTFLSSRQEGEFLAMETLIDRRVQPAKTSRPPVPPANCAALSVVGEDRFFPVSSLDGADAPLRFPCTALSPGGPPSTEGAAPTGYALIVPRNYKSPSFFLPFLLSLIVLSLVHLFCLYESRHDRERLFSYPHQLKGILEARRLYLLFVINNQILLMDFLGARMLLAVFRAHPVNPRPEMYYFFAVLALLLAVTVCFTAVFCTRALSRIRSERSPDTKELASGMFLAGAYLITTLWMIWRLPGFASEQVAMLLRLTHVTSGLSPVSAIVAILVGYFVWSWFQLKRLNWIASRKIDLLLKPPMAPLLRDRLDIIMQTTESLSPIQGSVIYGCFALLVLVDKFFLWRPLSGFEGFGFHLWITGWGFCLLLFTVILGCVHAGLLWQKLRNLLECLETTSMREAFRALGESGELTINTWDLAESERSFTIASKTVENMQALPGVTGQQITSAKKHLDIFIECDQQDKQVPAGAIDELHPLLNAGLEDALRVFENPTATFAPEEHLRYLALRLIAVIRYCMLHIRTLILGVAYCYLAAVLSIMFYAFEGRQTLGDLAVFVFAILLSWIAMMMVQFQGNKMLRLLEGSEDGDNNVLQVLRHLLSVGGVPLLAIVTAQYPAVGSFVLSILGPFLRALQ